MHVLAELEIWHSRPIAPTRRVALGRRDLPTDPAPGLGGILLGGIVATHIVDLDPDLLPDLHRLIEEVAAGRRIPQPRLRHRFQVDRIGLSSSVHRLLAPVDGEALTFEIAEGATAAQHILGAVYATKDQPPAVRRVLAAVLHRAARWHGPLGPALVAHLAGVDRAQLGGFGAPRFEDPRRWALSVLGFNDDGAEHPSKAAVLARFRILVREAHPDHGGAPPEAARRISELAAARRILLAGEPAA